MEKLARAESHAIRRDRYRAVLLALEGEEAVEIAEAIGRSRRSAQGWVYAYRDGGIAALEPARRKGADPKLPRHLEEAVRARLDGGVRPEDGVCTLRGKDVVRILEQEFGVKHTLGSIYGVLGRLGYSCLKPRPRHEKNDPAALTLFKGQAPPLPRRRETPLPHGAAKAACGLWTKPASGNKAL